MTCGTESSQADNFITGLVLGFFIGIASTLLYLGYVLNWLEMV